MYRQGLRLVGGGLRLGLGGGLGLRIDLGFKLARYPTLLHGNISKFVHEIAFQGNEMSLLSPLWFWKKNFVKKFFSLPNHFFVFRFFYYANWREFKFHLVDITILVGRI